MSLGCALLTVLCNALLVGYFGHRLIRLEKPPSIVCMLLPVAAMQLAHHLLQDDITGSSPGVELATLTFFSVLFVLIILAWELRQKIPFLGDLAFLGWRFRGTH